MAKGDPGVRTTALARYALLESTGAYFDGLSAEPREVVVRFGEATLTLQDFEDMPVAHWALGGLKRLDGSREGELRLAPDMEGDERLAIRDPQMIEAIEAVCTELDRRPPRRRGRGRRALWTGAAAAALAAILLVLTPGMAERLAPLVPAEQEQRLGEAVAGQAMRLAAGGAAPRICDAPSGRAALDRMTARLAAEADSHVPIRVRVIAQPSPNVFAAPGGQVILFSGLLDAAGGPDEVAAVLAHQVGHVVRRDPLRGMLRAAGSAGVLGLVLGDFVGGAATAEMAEAALAADYGREAERAADAYAHALLGKAGLPAAALARIFERLERAEREPRGLLRHFASHPEMADRIAAARAADRVGGAPFRPSLDDPGWIALQQICE
jgi:Zn-dependent protease with chaperone function